MKKSAEMLATEKSPIVDLSFGKYGLRVERLDGYVSHIPLPESKEVA